MNKNNKVDDNDLPGLYQSANRASIDEQNKYFFGIGIYLILLIVAALFTFFSDGKNDPTFKIIATILFLATLGIVIWLRLNKPDDIWYNGRAVAESVKTRSWRWMMHTEPYISNNDDEIATKHFIKDLKNILSQNQSLIGKLGNQASIKEPISEKMKSIRSFDLKSRFEVYKLERITNQALWYSKKSKFNKRKATLWFWSSVCLHSIAIILLLYNIKDPTLKLPIEIVAVCATSVLTWLQAKKFNELSFSYSLTAHEIVLIRSEINAINTEEELSDYVMNCENAFSREHTQWVARKSE